MDEVVQILIQYSEFVAMMLPWVLISALIVAGIERLTCLIRGPDWATREGPKATNEPGTL